MGQILFNTFLLVIPRIHDVLVVIFLFWVESHLVVLGHGAEELGLLHLGVVRRSVRVLDEGVAGGVVEFYGQREILPV